MIDDDVEEARKELPGRNGHRRAIAYRHARPIYGYFHGFSVQSISEYANGQKQPNPCVILELADGRVTVEALLGFQFVDDPPRE